VWTYTCHRMSALLRLLARILVGSLVVLALAAGVVKLKYGGGEPFPDVGTKPLIAADALEVLVETDYPPGNVTVSQDGRIFFNLHPFAEPQRFTDVFVFELVDGKKVPYPSIAAQPDFIGALGMTVDRQNRLWITRPAGLEDRTTRVVAYDLKTNKLVFEYEFEAGVAPFAQDLRVTPDGKTVILADTGIFRFTAAALIVLDVETRTARRVLEGHPSVTPQDWVIQSIDGPHKLLFGLVTFQVGVDGIAISHDGEWLYYATMSHDTAYRLPIKALRNPELSADDLAHEVDVFGPKPLSDGIDIDSEGQLYITDIEHGGLARLKPNGALETLVNSKEVVWADGVALTSDGAALFTDSEIPAYIDQLARPPAEERVHRKAPHRIYRLPL